VNKQVYLSVVPIHCLKIAECLPKLQKKKNERIKFSSFISRVWVWDHHILDEFETDQRHICWSEMDPKLDLRGKFEL